MVPKYDFLPTGELTFTISEPYADGIQTVWQDGKRRRIEEFLGNILETFGTVAKFELERRKQRAVQLQREIEESRRRYKEEQKIQRLEGQLKRWKRSLEAHTYANAVEAAIIKSAGKVDPESELGQWVQWIRAFADHIDPSTRDDIGSERIYW